MTEAKFDSRKKHSVSDMARDLLDGIFTRTDFLWEFEIKDILLDLSTYDYDEMVRKSLQLLNKHFSKHRTLFRRAVQAQVLLKDESVRVSKAVNQKLPMLHRLATTKLVDVKQTEELTKILGELIELCQLKGVPEEHTVNQRILYNHGILEDAFLILSNIDTAIEGNDGQVCQKTFQLMRAMAQGNPTVQNHLFDRLDMLLSIKGAPAELAECLTEAFTGNFNACKKVTGQQVQKVMSLVAQHRENVPQFLDLLRAIVKVEDKDLPLKRNQSYVMTFFLQKRSEIATVLDQKQADRASILTGKQTKALHYLTAMVDLLATCAQGENQDIESICQSIFKIPELLKILSNNSIPDSSKRPFVRFFTWVYLSSTGGYTESLAHYNRELWDYMNSLKTDLKDLQIFVTDNQDRTKELLKQQCAKRKREKDEPTRGKLHYFFDAVMPFLETFCTNYNQHEKQTRDEQLQLKELTEALEKFMDAIIPHISVKRHQLNLVKSVASLISASSSKSDDASTNTQVEDGGYTQPVHAHSNARKDYHSYYEEEDTLNSQLQNFAVNMKRVYEGVNSVKVQIQVDVETASHAKYSEEGGDEELPLGTEFQDHIKCFIDEKKNETPNEKSNEKPNKQMNEKPKVKPNEKPKEKYKLAGSLVKQLEISQRLQGLSEHEKAEQFELDFSCLHLLRGCIHNKIVQLPEHWEKNPEEHKDLVDRISELQTELCGYGVVQSVLGHLNHPDDDLVRELLAFMAALLFNGNENVQDKMHEYFTGTKKERFFFAVRDRMQLSALATKEDRLLHAMQEAEWEKIQAEYNDFKTKQAAGETGKWGEVIDSQFRDVLSVINRDSMNESKHVEGGETMRRQSSATNGTSANYQSTQGEREYLKGQPGKRNWKSSAVAPEEKRHEAEKEKCRDEEHMSKPHVHSGTRELEYHDDYYLELVLRVVGRMCDNQHRGLQDYLREQPDNVKTVNLVAETTRILSILSNNVSLKSAPVVIQLFDTLAEFTFGNLHNQAVVFDNNVCEYVNHMLSSKSGEFCEDHIEWYHLRMSIAILLRALSEENHPDLTENGTQGISTGSKRGPRTNVEVLKSVDYKALMTTMQQAYVDRDKDTFKDGRDRDLVLDVGFSFYHILCKKRELQQAHTKLCQPEELKTNEKIAWDYFAGDSMSIEILKDGFLQKAYFRVRDKVSLREEIKEKLKYSVDRSTPTNKLRSFIDWSEDIIKDIKHQRRVNENPLGKFFILSEAWLNPAVWLVSLILCTIVLVTWRAKPSKRDPIPDMSDWPGAQICIYAFGAVHNVLSLCLAISYFLSNHLAFPDWQDLFPWLRTKTDTSDDDEDKKRVSYLEVRFFSFFTFYYLAFFCFSIMGTMFYGYFFSVHLLHVVRMSQLLQRVIQAVTRNGVSLILVAILGLAIMFMFSLLAFAFYREYMDSANGRQCRTAYECFVTLVHHGFVEGMYTTFEQKLEDLSFGETLTIVAFDLIFFIFITTIGLNIIFGIIVDTFAELRDAKWQTDKDMKSNCFICSRESYDFETKAGGFRKHVNHEHNQWAYLFFFIHLDETRHNDYSALELYVHKLLKKKELGFFPLNRAMSLASKENSSEQKLNALVSQMEVIMSKMKEEEAEKQRQKEKQRQEALENSTAEKLGSGVDQHTRRDDTK